MSNPEISRTEETELKKALSGNHWELNSTEFWYNRAIEEFEKRITEYKDISEEDKNFVPEAFSEMLANAMKHGNGFDPNKKVVIKFEIEPDRIAIEVQDEGSGYDPAAVPNPTAQEHILESHGRGNLIIESAFDEFEVKMPPEVPKTTVRAVKHIKK